ncbi:MAG TPA: ATP-dependent DNA helicase RecG, partial [Firmicutes bacterium]|nr:ATP-dependent DNA helicase RecG [Bacillota bacterium]
MQGKVGLESSIQELPGIGPSRARLFGRLGIKTVADLLFWFPRQWEDRRESQPLALIRPGNRVTVRGRLGRAEERRPRRDLTITSFELGDGTGSLALVFFNQPYRKGQLRRGQEVMATGKVEMRYGQLQMINPEVEIVVRPQGLHSGRIVPIYPATEGLSSRLLRSAVYTALKTCGADIEEIVPADTRERQGLLPREVAIREMHFPTGWEQVQRARRSLAFEELLLLQLGLLYDREEGEGIAHGPDGELVARFLAQLPFTLTGAQRKALAEIARDMEAMRPMNRLLQGDVGSGKTVVAAYALVKTVENGFQGVVMVPTEILAEQHYLNLCRLLQPIGIEVVLLTGSMTGREKERVRQRIEGGEARVVVGTHAVIQEGVDFARLGLVVIDEQHRFGVSQRSSLLQKGKACDLLVMTATPIPRTLALVFYSDLDITVLDELPPGRKPVQTYWVSEKIADRVYAFLRREVKEGRQAYIVCPLVEESDKLQVQAATELAAYLQERVFPDLRLGLLHGRLPLEEKERVMEEFRRGKIDILVATTVIEVGVDVPNASVMVIQNAERFGLAQLHQLRGRVGRGEYQSYCILIGSPTTEEGR